MFPRTVIFAIVAALATSVMPLSAAAAPPDPFSGRWTALDLDGSAMSLSIGGGRDVRKVRLSDDDATGGVCLARHGRAVARGAGVASGNTLTGEYDDVRCLDGPTVPVVVAFEFVHDLETDTLTDDTGVVWFRQGVVPSGPFLGGWTAVDLDGSDMTLSFAPDGEVRSVTFYDVSAGVCGGAPATGWGTGEITGDTIAGTFDFLVCLNGEEMPEGHLGFEWVHDPATDTLNDISVWHRPGHVLTDPFLGTWAATDLDGSAMWVSFAGPDVASRSVAYYDLDATACGGGPAFGQGAGDIAGDTIAGTFEFLECRSGEPIPDAHLGFTWVHDPATDTLTDHTGVVWFRPGLLPTDPFLGTWGATDLDGSAMWVSFAPEGASRNVTLYDDNATGGVCESGGGWASATGSGDVTGRTITGTFDTVTCLETGNEFHDLGFIFVHDHPTDTLTDDSGVIWSREVSPGPAPFEGDWKSVDVDGSNQTLWVEHRGRGLIVLASDDAASGACTDGGPAELTGEGAVSADGGTLHVAFRTLNCTSGEPNPALELPSVVDFAYDRGTDTLVDSFGVVWSRG